MITNLIWKSKIAIAIFLCMAFWAGSAFAQESAEKYGVQFPVVQLGNCDSISSCRSFCEDPVNKSSCVSFAKQKGFYKRSLKSELTNSLYKEQTGDRQKEMLEKATSELGCTSPDACRDLCHQEANFDKCSSFAKKHNFSGGEGNDHTRVEVLQKAREALGCDSPDACRAFCQQEGNRQKCSEFAKGSGLRGGEKRVGPGGCSSEENCKSFCSDPSNFSACSSFGGQGGSQGGPRGQFKGPGGCTSEESCRSHCEQNPADCKIVPGQFNGAGSIDNPEMAAEQFKQFCSENPDKCQGGENFSPFSKEGRGKFEEFCKDNPERCRGEGDKFRGFEPRGNPEQFCKENPDKCAGGNFKPEEFGGGKEEEFCKSNPEKCKGPQNQNSTFDPKRMPANFRPGDRMPEGFKSGDGQRPPEGFRPKEGSNHPQEGQKPPEGLQSGPGGGAPPPAGGDSGSGGGAPPPPGDGGSSGSGSGGSSGGESGGSSGGSAPSVQGVQTSIFNQLLSIFK